MIRSLAVSFERVRTLATFLGLVGAFPLLVDRAAADAVDDFGVSMV